MDPFQPLCWVAILGVVAVVSASYGHIDSGSHGRCLTKKYRVDRIGADPFLTAADADGKNGGIIIDVLEAMKSASGGWFDYNLTRQSEKKTYGDFVIGVSTGFITDLVNKKSDLAAVDLAVKKSRHTVVDLLQPFVQSETRILVNNANGVIGANPIYYVSGFITITNILSNSPNATLLVIYNSAKAANLMVDFDTLVPHCLPAIPRQRTSVKLPV